MVHGTKLKRTNPINQLNQSRLHEWITGDRSTDGRHRGAGPGQWMREYAAPHVVPAPSRYTLAIAA
jgi:hypothetical protein